MTDFEEQTAMVCCEDCNHHDPFIQACFGNHASHVVKSDIIGDSVVTVRVATSTPQKVRLFVCG